jgi:hypothetical protein
MIASMLFFPSREFAYQPADFGLQFEEVWCETQDHVRLHGWFLKAENNATDLCLLFFHGNAGNISIRLSKAREWINRGVSVFLIDYRGFGRSAGKMHSGNDIYLDAQAAYRWLNVEKTYKPAQIILYGESVGSVPAIELATRESVKGLVLEAAFTSLKEVAKIHYGFAPDFLLQNFQFPNEEKISKIKCSAFIIHGTADEIIPFSMGERLFKAAPGPKEFLPVSGGHHNDLEETGGRAFFDQPFHFLTHGD